MMGRVAKRVNHVPEMPQDCGQRADIQLKLQKKNAMEGQQGRNVFLVDRFHGLLFCACAHLRRFNMIRVRKGLISKERRGVCIYTYPRR